MYNRILHHYDPNEPKSLRSVTNSDFCEDALNKFGIKNQKVIYKRHGIIGIQVHLNWKGLSYDYTLFFANYVCVTYVNFFDSKFQVYQLQHIAPQVRNLLLYASMGVHLNMSVSAVGILPKNNHIVNMCVFKLNNLEKEKATKNFQFCFQIGLSGVKQNVTLIDHVYQNPKSYNPQLIASKCLSRRQMKPQDVDEEIKNQFKTQLSDDPPQKPYFELPSDYKPKQPLGRELDEDAITRDLVDTAGTYYVGAGGFGVILGRDLLGEPAALKTMEFNDNVLREALALRMFNRRGIPRFYSLTTKKDGTCVIAMEAVQGLTLSVIANRLIDKHFSNGTSYYLLDIFSQIFHLVEYIHKKGFCHGDISLRNIIVDEVVTYSEDGKIEKKPEVWLVDFNLAEPLTNDGKVNGFTPEYSPPEAIQSKKTKINRAQMDIFNIGAVLFKIVTGHSLYSVMRARQSAGEKTKKRDGKMKEEFRVLLNQYDVQEIKRTGKDPILETVDAVISKFRKQEKLLLIAKDCLNFVPDNRKSISKIIQELNESFSS